MMSVAASTHQKDEGPVRALHEQLLAAWNGRDAAGFADLFTREGYVVGFDGSQMEGREQIATEIGAVFADHVTATYVAKIEGLRFLTPDVAVLRAAVGMIPPGQADLNPAANALQTLVATRSDDGWRIAVFQNTPAQFHGRPELAARMTDELRALL